MSTDSYSASWAPHLTLDADVHAHLGSDQHFATPQGTGRPIKRLPCVDKPVELSRAFNSDASSLNFDSLHPHAHASR